MDLGFFRRAERLLAERSHARLDYGMLIATLEALQLSRASARAGSCSARHEPRPPSDHDPLVELLTAGPEWRDAIPRQAGCFNRAFTGAGETGRKPK